MVGITSRNEDIRPEKVLIINANDSVIDVYPKQCTGKLGGSNDSAFADYVPRARASSIERVPVARHDEDLALPAEEFVQLTHLLRLKRLGRQI